MPYIKVEDRTRAALDPHTEGELNYAITMFIKNYLKRKEKVSYADYNGVIGVLECAKMELYRRLVAPYEEIKIKENTDVY